MTSIMASYHFVVFTRFHALKRGAIFPCTLLLMTLDDPRPTLLRRVSLGTMRESGIHRGNGKRPDGVTAFPFSRRKTWFRTVVAQILLLLVSCLALLPGLEGLPMRLRTR